MAAVRNQQWRVANGRRFDYHAAMGTDDEQHLMLLGKIAANGQAFELAAASVLGQTIGVKQHVAGVVAGHMQTAGVLNTIESLTTDELVKSWVKLARKASEARNKLIHGAWGRSESDPSLDVHIQRGKFRYGADRLVELEEAVRLLSEAITTAPGLNKWVQEAIE